MQEFHIGRVINFIFYVSVYEGERPTISLAIFAINESSLAASANYWSLIQIKSTQGTKKTKNWTLALSIQQSITRTIRQPYQAHTLPFTQTYFNIQSNSNNCTTERWQTYGWCLREQFSSAGNFEKPYKMKNAALSLSSIMYIYIFMYVFLHVCIAHMYRFQSFSFLVHYISIWKKIL